MDHNSEILVRFGSLLRGVIEKRVGPDAREDVFQEVALAVVKSEFRPTEPKQLQHWLCSIALRQCAYHHRKESRQAALVVGSSLANASTHAPDPLEWLLERESEDQLRQALAGIAPEHRNLLACKYVRKLTYQQIASELQITVHQAEYRVQVAKQAMRDELLRMNNSQRVE